MEGMNRLEKSKERERETEEDRRFDEEKEKLLKMKRGNQEKLLIGVIRTFRR
jgi:hypothetical protein